LVRGSRAKGGALRLAALGTFDNFNQAVAGLKGLFAAAAGTICDTLMAPALDEASTHYGLIGEAVSHPPDFASVSFRLRAAARHHDGKPITVEDVIYSFEIYKRYNPFIGAFYRHVARVEQSGEPGKDRHVEPNDPGPRNRNIRSKIVDLRELGFADPVKMITSSSAVLTYAMDNIREKIIGLRELGFADPVKMITSVPAIIGYGMANIRGKVTDLRELGFTD
jgi:hypothetical protein